MKLTIAAILTSLGLAGYGYYDVKSKQTCPTEVHHSKKELLHTPQGTAVVTVDYCK